MSISNNEFFRVLIKGSRPGPGNDWRAKATIVRKDSGERVDGVVALGATEKEAERNLETAINHKLETMPKPYDWGRDPEPPAVIASYLALKEQLYAINVKVERHPEFAEQARRDATTVETAWLSALRERISRMSDSQRSALFKATPEQIREPDNPWNLDAITAKLDLLRLVDDEKRTSDSAAEELKALMESAG